ncbi:MAG: YihY/virulence factor BrkB family protein [Chloroflexi bacterium]|nr:YihY/virulence factor BrkB family protein [Chloroflexota bacterium]
MRNDCTTMAAAISYYGLFSLFPMVLGMLSIAGILLQSPHWQGAFLYRVSTYFPGSEAFLRENLRAVLRIQGTLGIIAIIGLLWAGKAVFTAITTGVNRAWGISKRRRILVSTLIDMSLVVGTGLFFALSVLITAVDQVLADAGIRGLGLGLTHSVVWEWTVSLSPVVLTFLAFLLVYKVLPNTTVTWLDALPGAVLATLLFEVAKNVFLWYSSSYVHYESVYGSVGTVIGLLLWAYVSSVILLLGAELSSEFAKSRQRRTPWSGDT